MCFGPNVQIEKRNEEVEKRKALLRRLVIFCIKYIVKLVAARTGKWCVGSVRVIHGCLRKAFLIGRDRITGLDGKSRHQIVMCMCITLSHTCPSSTR